MEDKQKDKIESLKNKAKKILQQAKQLEQKEKAKERKERARELILIGAAFAQFHDRKELLEYLKNPQYLTLDENGTIIKTDNVPQGKPASILINPKIAQKKEKETN